MHRERHDSGYRVVISARERSAVCWVECYRLSGTVRARRPQRPNKASVSTLSRCAMRAASAAACWAVGLRIKESMPAPPGRRFAVPRPLAA
jgi:hypothetical protein